MLFRSSQPVSQPINQSANQPASQLCVRCFALSELHAGKLDSRMPETACLKGCVFCLGCVCVLVRVFCVLCLNCVCFLVRVFVCALFKLCVCSGQGVCPG